MSQLKCLDCDAVFDERDAGTYTESTPSEAWGVRAVTRETFLSCPECGSHELEDHEEVEDESDFDFEKIKAEAKERERDEFTRTLIDIAISPWKKSA